jgi:hypothetical protein
MEQSLLAYSLRQAESGWMWNVYDLDGDVVASGTAATQSAAEQFVFEVLQPGGERRIA